MEFIHIIPINFVLQDGAMSQAVSRWLAVVETSARSRVSGICGAQSGTGICCFAVSSVFLC